LWTPLFTVFALLYRVKAKRWVCLLYERACWKTVVGAGLCLCCRVLKSVMDNVFRYTGLKAVLKGSNAFVQRIPLRQSSMLHLYSIWRA
jgi:hypothetical protein